MRQFGGEKNDLTHLMDSSFVQSEEIVNGREDVMAIGISIIWKVEISVNNKSKLNLFC